MSLTPEIAKSLLEKLINVKPIFSEQGPNKGQHVEKYYQFELSGDLMREILIRRDIKNGITAYINKLSIDGSKYPGFDGIIIKKEYSKGYKGANGKAGLSGAAKRRPSLDPEKNNDVLNISASNESAFLNLIDWYSGKNQERPNSLNLELVITKNEKNKSDEIQTTIDSIDSDTYALELLEDIATIEEDESESPTEKLELRSARIGQGKFRKNTTAIWGGDAKCAVTGLQIPALLNASHIKPWRDCDSKREKLSGSNGILLCVHLDRLFDRYLIGFEKASTNSPMIRSLICSPKLKSNFSLLGIIGITDSLNLDLSMIEGSNLVELEKNLDIHLAKVQLEI